MITRLRILVLALVLTASAAFAQTVSPFLPLGTTTSIAVTGTAQSLALTDSTLAGPMRQVVLTTIGNQTVFFRADGVTATLANAMPLMASTQFVVSVPAGITTLSVISATTGSTLYATTGVTR